MSQRARIPSSLCIYHNTLKRYTNYGNVMYDDDDQSFWDDDKQRPFRTCERCGAGDDMSKPHPMCGEVQLAFGLIAWLCHDCRKEWHRSAKNLPVQDEYAEAALRLEFWKNCVGPDSDPNDVEEGIRLWRAVDLCEKRINDHACEWLISSTDELRS